MVSFRSVLACVVLVLSAVSSVWATTYEEAQGRLYEAEGWYNMADESGDIAQTDRAACLSFADVVKLAVNAGNYPTQAAKDAALAVIAGVRSDLGFAWTYNFAVVSTGDYGDGQGLFEDAEAAFGENLYTLTYSKASDAISRFTSAKSGYDDLRDQVDAANTALWEVLNNVPAGE